jgi:hypothetical protein
METQKYTIDELVKEFCDTNSYVGKVTLYSVASWPLKENVINLPVKRVEFDGPKFVRYHPAKPAEVRRLLDEAAPGTVLDFGNEDLMLRKEGSTWVTTTVQNIELKADDVTEVRSWFEDLPDFNIY